MAEIFEIIMLCLFGASWPVNVVKSYKVRTTKEKAYSFYFLFLSGIFSVLALSFYPLLLNGTF